MTESGTQPQGSARDVTERRFEPFLSPLDPVAEQVRALIEPIVDFEGCELVQLLLVRSKQSTQVRVFADLKEPGASIGLELLTRLNRLIGDSLDVEAAEHGLFSGAYIVEVSSPGLDRPLAKRSHFDAAVGQVIKLRSRVNLGAGKGVTGKLLEATPDHIRVLPNGSEDEADAVAVFFEDIDSAHCVAQFDDPSSKPVRQNKRTKKKSGRPQR